MKRFVSLVLFFLTAIYGVWGQTQYASSHIEQAVRKLKIENVDSIPVGNYVIEKNKHEVVVRKSKCNVIEHVGIKLFSEDMRKANPLPVYDFLEYAYLDKEFAITDDKLTYIDVKFTEGSWKDIRLVTDSTECMVKNIDSKKYSVEWKVKGKGNVSLVFPVKYSLILGESRRKIEQDFIEKVCKYKPKYNANVTLSDSSGLKKIAVDSTIVYERIGEIYLDPVINGNTYFSKQDSLFIPLSDKLFPELTVKNAILLKSNDILRDYDVEARFIRMENEVDVKSLTLRQLVDFALAEGCKPYVGISGIKDNILKGTLFFYNNALGYDHIVSFTADVSKIETHEMVFKARVYLFSPTTNVKELFLDDKLKK